MHQFCSTAYSIKKISFNIKIKNIKLKKNPWQHFTDGKAFAKNYAKTTISSEPSLTHLEKLNGGELDIDV